MIQRIEFTNRSPTVSDCPKLELRMFARALVKATQEYKEKQKADEATERQKEGEQPSGFPAEKRKKQPEAVKRMQV